jgi:hypothetical protein
VTDTASRTPTNITCSVGACAADGRTITWTIGNLATTASPTLTYRVQAPANVSDGPMVNTASITSTQEPYTHSSCQTSGSPNNCAILSLALEGASGSEEFGFLDADCDPATDANCQQELVIQGDDGSKSNLTITNGSGGFSFEAKDCGNDCVGSEWEVLPYCSGDCRALVTTEYDRRTTAYPTVTQLDAFANANGDVDYLDENEVDYYWFWYTKREATPPILEPQAMRFCSGVAPNYYLSRSGSQASPFYANSWLEGTDAPSSGDFPCLWKYQENTNWLNIQWVVDGEDPGTILRK